MNQCVLCHTIWAACRNPYAHRRVSRWYRGQGTHRASIPAPSPADPHPGREHAFDITDTCVECGQTWPRFA